MFRIMVTDLLRHGQIKTTVAKAKEIRPMAEKMVTLAKGGTLHDRRRAAAFITDQRVLKTVFDELIRGFPTRWNTVICCMALRQRSAPPAVLLAWLHCKRNVNRALPEVEY